MSHVSTSGQTEENKRILKELEDQKRQLKLKSSQHIVAAPPPAGIPVQTQQRPTALETVGTGGSSRHAHNRQALHEAMVSSYGFYIGTDSQFGNPILAVLPRLDAEKKSPP